MTQADVRVNIGLPRAVTCRVRIENREAPIEVRARRQVIMELTGKELSPISWPVLVVEEKEKSRWTATRKKEALTDYMFFIIGEAVSETTSMEDFTEYLVRYYEDYGLMFNELEISVHEIRSRLRNLFLLIPNYRYTTKEKLADSAFIAKLETAIYKPYLYAQEHYPEYEGSFVIYQIAYIEESNEFLYFPRPTKKGEKGFKLPNKKEGPEKQEGIVTKKAMLDWCQKVILINLNHMLNKNVEYVTRFDKKENKLILTMRPVDLYTACILNFIQRDLPLYKKTAEDVMRTRESWARKDRRDVMAGYRTWYNRQKITREEYKELESYSKKLLPQNINDKAYNKDELKEILTLHLEKISENKKKSYRKKKPATS